MRILLVGSGGREHALAWKILQSPRLTQLYLSSSVLFSRLSAHAKVAQTSSFAEEDKQALSQFAREHEIDLVVIGPEKPLAAGLADALTQVGIAVFGPTQQAAQIETSKVFAKNFMLRHHIPTAQFATFSDFTSAVTHLKQVTYPVVIKAAGLAAGKGVFLPQTSAEAETVLKQILLGQVFGPAGAEVVIEERLSGKEISLLAFSDGISVKVMPPARDHKRLRDGDQGPNTGGMGAYAPVNDYSADQLHSITTTILQAAIDGLRLEGRPFVGVLYAGLMMTAAGPKVLEFNARFGDPETQVLMPLLASDLLDILEACTQQRLAALPIHWHKKSAACVVLASADYPAATAISTESPAAKHLITGLSRLEQLTPDSLAFHAATYLQDEKFYTAGGRVLAITGLGDTFAHALAHAYAAVDLVSFEGMHYRRDIGQNQSSANLSTNSAELNPYSIIPGATTDFYAQAGVDIGAGNRTIALMSAAVRSTYGKEVLAGIGAFGGMYHADALQQMQNPVLVASTDGIGTKVHLAAQAKSYRSLGHDIVNHSINDILVQGARPLFFLDYVASSRLVPELMADIVTGMAEACLAAGCALLGGETAEMPDVYAPEMFDVAGTIVGVVERDQALPRPTLAAGDVLLGIASSGPHTNGYSLIRKIFADVPLNTVFPELGKPLAEALLAPHRSYLPVLKEALHHSTKPIKALVHITGGGFVENIPRVLPATLSAHIHLDSWPLPALFQLIQQRGQIPLAQMYRVFNMGIGMILITSREHVALLQQLITEPVWELGQLITGNHEVLLT